MDNLIGKEGKGKYEGYTITKQSESELEMASKSGKTTIIFGIKEDGTVLEKERKSTNWNEFWGSKK